MTPFAIAGIQMQLGHGSNIDAMRQRVDLTMHLFPWVQLVMFSELACYGPLLQYAQPLPGALHGERFADDREQLGVIIGDKDSRRLDVTHTISFPDSTESRLRKREN